MRARDFIFEIGTLTASASTATSQTSDSGQNVGKLTALVTNLQKQIQDLQKNALQTSSQVKTLQQPQPMGQQPGTPPDAASAKTPSTPTSSVSTSTVKPAITPGVNQQPQVTTMKIKQQLSTNQGQSV